MRLDKRNYINTIALGAAMIVASLLAHAAVTIYPAIAQAGPDLEAALKEAAKTKRRVLVDFGGNWCGDCIVLDKYLQEAGNADLLRRHYVVVHVNVGDKGITDNFVLAERYGIPLKKGVPALAVLEGDGRIVFAQKQGEFESMRKM